MKRLFPFVLIIVLFITGCTVKVNNAEVVDTITLEIVAVGEKDGAPMAVVKYLGYPESVDVSMLEVTDTKHLIGKMLTVHIMSDHTLKAVKLE